MRPAALAAAIVVASCTPAERGAPPSPGPTPTPSGQQPSPAVAVPVMAPPGEPAVDGIRLAAEQTGLGLALVDPGGDPAGALREQVSARPPVIMVVGAAQAVVATRPDIEAGRVPVMLVDGDLYSSRSLFRYAFQASVPLRWQARVLAHYLVTDRRSDGIAVEAGSSAREVFAVALAEEGVSPVEPPADADAVLMGGAHRLPAPGQRAAMPEAALSLIGSVPPGTVACAPYTWAGWAESIARVARFRDRFAERFGREPGTPEQQGYESMRAVASALDRTGGRGGDALIRALESFREETYSSTPVRLGPDDHVLAEESHLGVFAVAAPDEQATGEDLAPVAWRPVMRTFTTNGKRVNLARRDVRVFFPAWRPRGPRPNYWRSELGIVTRPAEDPLH